MARLDPRRFSALWLRAAVDATEERADDIYQRVADHYDEPHRRYHTAAHIVHCLERVDLIPPGYPDLVAVELGVWFHDVIYTIGDPDNERLSAEWFAEIASGELPRPLIDQVWRMINVTDHRTPPRDLDSAYLVDIDLSSFGLPRDEFLRDSRAVREEMTHVDDDAYYTQQRAFLARLLARDRIYHTPLFHDLYEARARDNIQSVIDHIDGR